MPIIKTENGVMFFAHVPKCAGTSVEKYLEKRFGPTSFVDRTWKFNRIDWNMSSPQHVEVSTFEKLFDPSFFDAMFTVTRHPVDRFGVIAESW